MKLRTLMHSSAGTLALILSGSSGVVHVTSGGETDRVEFTDAILDDAGLSSVQVLPVPPESHGGAERPSDSRLSVARFELLTGVSPRPWRESLREVIRAWVPS